MTSKYDIQCANYSVRKKKIKTIMSVRLMDRNAKKKIVKIA